VILRKLILPIPAFEGKMAYIEINGSRVSSLWRREKSPKKHLDKKISKKMYLRNDLATVLPINSSLFPPPLYENLADYHN
jgi:hypothetical protein